MGAAQSVCLHCGRAAGSIFIHGHEQCLACGTVQVPCCEGAACESPPAAQTME